MRQYSKKGWEERKKKREGYSEFYQALAKDAKGRRCQNCGRKLSGHVSEVAHILPKGSFPEIATNPDNILYLCSNFVYGYGGCHDVFDSSWKNAQKMDIWSTAVEQYLLFRGLIGKGPKKTINVFENALLNLPEQFNTLTGFDWEYGIGTKGTVVEYNETDKVKVLYNEPEKDSDGDVVVKLVKDGRVSDFKVSHLVADAFIINNMNYTSVGHIDGDKENNHFTNLSWVKEKKKKKVEKTYQKFTAISRINGKFESKIILNNRVYNLGLFDDEVKAMDAHIAAKRNYIKHKKFPK
jgi:hypothetical protein